MDIECNKWVCGVDIWERLRWSKGPQLLSLNRRQRDHIVIIPQNFGFSVPCHVAHRVRNEHGSIPLTMSQTIVYKTTCGHHQKKHLFYSLNWKYFFQLMKNEMWRRKTQIMVAFGGEIWISDKNNLSLENYIFLYKQKHACPVITRKCNTWGVLVIKNGLSAYFLCLIFYLLFNKQELEGQQSRRQKR